MNNKSIINNIKEELEQIKTKPIETTVSVIVPLFPVIPIYYYGLRLIDFVYVVLIIIAYFLLWKSRRKRFELDNLCYDKVLLSSTLSYLLQDKARKEYTDLSGDIYAKLQIIRREDNQTEQIITWNVKGKQRYNKKITEIRMILSGSAYMKMIEFPLTAFDKKNNRALAIKLSRERALNRQVIICLENEGINPGDDYDIEIKLRIVESVEMEDDWQVYIFDPRNISRKIDHLYLEVENHYPPLEQSLVELFRVDRDNLKRNIISREKLDINSSSHSCNVTFNKVTGRNYLYLLILTPKNLYSEE